MFKGHESDRDRVFEMLKIGRRKLKNILLSLVTLSVLYFKVKKKSVLSCAENRFTEKRFNGKSLFKRSFDIPRTENPG